MLTRIRIRNFKKLEDVDIELGNTTVLIGPNNSGKTSALQALALWETGLRQWNAKRQGKESPEKRPGVSINRLELIQIPSPNLIYLWSDLHTRDMKRKEDGKMDTKNIRMDVIVEGITNDKNWACGFEFDYTGEDVLMCRPIRKTGFENTPVKDSKFTDIPDEATAVKVAFLPPMSGLAAIEAKLEPGRINVLLGEGQTAQVLRNLCYPIFDKSKENSDWDKLTGQIKDMFGVTLEPPRYVTERGEIRMSYKEDRSEKVFDLSSSGRGLQQTLLLLAYIYANPGTVLLLDEPDAHLEILRQRQTYQLLTELAEEKGCQIIAASHSEVVLNEAADRDVVVAFVGKPHRIDDKGSQVLKALREIGFDQYYLAEETGWILYMEGSTDLSILKVFADILKFREAQKVLEKPFVKYVGNEPQDAIKHFWGLRYAKSDLVGIAIFDHLQKGLPENINASDSPLTALQWNRRELENYLCMEEVLIAYARQDVPDDLSGFELFDIAEKERNKERRIKAMRESIAEVTSALKTLKKPDPWSPDIKVTDDFLDPLFDTYFQNLGLPNMLRKTDYHVLARLVPKDKIDPEIIEKFKAIIDTAGKARRRV